MENSAEFFARKKFLIISKFVVNNIVIMINLVTGAHVTQFRFQISIIMLIISSHPHAACSSDFEITQHLITP